MKRAAGGPLRSGLVANGLAYCWGYSGATGDGVPDYVSLPQQITVWR